MRTTTKMLVAAAQNARKRDSRGRFTSEHDDEMRMGGGYRMNGGYESRMNEPRNYGDNRRGETRNDGDYGPYMNDRDYDRRRNGGGEYTRPEGRKGGGTYNAMDDDEEERQIGFRSRPQANMAHERNNVVSYSRHAVSGSHDKELTSEDAEEWVRAMQNEDGTKGAHWTKEQIKQVMAQHGVSGVEPVEFWAVMNAMYSDYCKVAKKFNLDRPDFYAELAKAFLNDKDAVEGKAAAYFHHIVKD